MKRKQAGFTLIEVIIVMVLVGILAVMAGMGILSGVQSYIFAKENAPTSQKAAAAMARMSREFMELSSITSVGTSSIVYTDINGNHALALVGGEIRMIDGSVLPTATTGDVLIGNINSMTLSFYKGALSWTTSDDIKDLTIIQIDIVVDRADSGIGTISFSTRVNPRNTGLSNAPVGS
jgi:prepilin-type N-terminal cleavage/methylation domain-containing protein